MSGGTLRRALAWASAGAQGARAARLLVSSGWHLLNCIRRPARLVQPAKHDPAALPGPNAVLVSFCRRGLLGGEQPTVVASVTSKVGPSSRCLRCAACRMHLLSRSLRAIPVT